MTLIVVLLIEICARVTRMRDERLKTHVIDRIVDCDIVKYCKC